MKACISLTLTSAGSIARVVSEQDYHERGPHACSYETPAQQRPDTAYRIAARWAQRNGYTVVPVNVVAAAAPT